MDTLQAQQLVKSHYFTQLGCYFSSVCWTDAHVSAASLIPGIVWCHTYLPHSGIDALRTVDSDAVYLDGVIDSPPLGWRIDDQEVWMHYANPSLSCGYSSLFQIELEQVSAFDSRYLNLICSSFDHWHAIALKESVKSAKIDRRFYLAKIEDGVVGAFSIHRNGGFAAIHDVCIEPGCRNNGLASPLLGKVVSFCRDARIIYLQSEKGWISKLYERNGFVVFHERTGLSRVNSLNES